MAKEPNTSWRAAALMVVLAGAVAAAPVSCAQIIGADKDRAGVVDAGADDATAVVVDDASGASVVTNTVAPCDPGQKRCSGACVSIDDPQFGCGTTTCTAACSVPHAASTKCANGACAAATCQAGRADCNGLGTDGCEADLTDAKTCGSCTSACPNTAPLCTPSGQCVLDCTGSPGTTQCGSSCVDLSSSAKACGGCSNQCPTPPDTQHAIAACVKSVCTIACNSGYADCDSNLTDGCEALSPYYTDADKDGQGAGAKMGDACKPPAGMSGNANDCADDNAMVFQGQTAYFAAPYKHGAGSSFDYDCDNHEVTQGAVTCPGTCATCTTGRVLVTGAMYANPCCGSVASATCSQGSAGPVCGMSAAAAVNCH